MLIKMLVKSKKIYIFSITGHKSLYNFWVLLSHSGKLSGGNCPIHCVHTSPELEKNSQPLSERLASFGIMEAQ